MIASSAQMVAEAKRHVTGLDVDQAAALLGRKDVLFVDIRDIRELEKTGTIPGALHVPRGLLEFWADPASPYHRKELSSGKKLVLYCAASWRSALAARTLMQMGFENVAELEGGFEAWERAGGQINRPGQDGTSHQGSHISPDQATTRVRDELDALGVEERLSGQIAFVLELDKLKQVWRQTPLLDKSRKENDAEHSWQLAMMALILVEYSNEKVDILRVLKMLLIHDIVEIDAGDSPAYTAITSSEQYEKECRAADRLFAILPPDLAGELRALWEEFEALASADARFAKAMDRLQPFLHNFFTDGDMWIRHEIRLHQVSERMGVMQSGSEPLMALVENLIRAGADRGYFLPD